MFQQVDDFRAESEALYDVMKDLGDADYETVTQFKDWTFNDVLQHLHFWNIGAKQSAEDPDGFSERIAVVMTTLHDQSLRQYESEFLGNPTGKPLLELWRSGCADVASVFGKIDPGTRLKWAGPDMSARSSITARQMETWAHGQAIFDSLGVERRDEDRIKNIAFLGINTFGWTFRNRGKEIPEPPPLVRLTAPSGALWEWHAPGDGNLIEGDATEFCQVVTQTRNVADTALRVEGESASQWMEFAQCFAGPVEQPPAPGSRHRVT